MLSKKSEGQLRLRRSKESERELGRWLLEHDGPDPSWAGINSSTGRVGHIAQLQFDCISRSYAAENKQVKVPVNILRWWLKIIDVATTQGKDPLLRIEPTNEFIAQDKLAKLKKKQHSLHIITADRHAQLLAAERKLVELERG